MRLINPASGPMIVWMVVHLALAMDVGQPMITEMPKKEISNSCAEGTVFDDQVGACCGSCDRGHGVALPCTGRGAGNDTVCVPCLDGVTYSSALSHEESCQPCSHCPPNAQPVHRCNVTHNTKCECVDGFWYDSEKRTCVKCFSCQPGFEVSRPCAPYQNTHCRPCAKGYYSSSYSYSSKCRLCSLCKPGQLVRTACSLFRDTDCVDANALLNGVKGTDEPMVTSVNLFPVYCAIPAFVLVSLVLFVIFKRWRQLPCKRSPPCKTSTVLNTQGSNVTAANRTIGHTTTACNKRHSGSDGANGCVNKEMKPMLLTGDSPVNCLPKEIIEQLERNLSGGDEAKNGWIALAKHLGYGDARIKAFVKDAGVKRVSPAKQFLQEWIYGSHATIRLLVDALENVDRADLALLIREDIDLTSKFNNNNPAAMSGPVHFV